MATWRAQPLDSKRLQLLMASAISVFVALLLAIALRGLFVRLLMLMAVLFATHLGFAAYVGSVRLKEFEAQARLRRAERERALADELARLDRAAADALELAAPAVRFPPLAIEPLDEPMPGVADDPIFPVEAEPDPDLVPDSEPVPTADPEPAPQPAVASEPDTERRSILEPDQQQQPDPEPGPDEPTEDERIAAAFKAAPTPQRRPARPAKARPIYIESQLDEPDDDRKAVND